MSQKSISTKKITVQDAVFTVDAEWRITSFNKEAEELLGIFQKDIIGKNCREVFSTTEQFEALCSLYGPLGSGKAMHDLRFVVSKANTGEKIVALVTALPISDMDGKLSGAVICMRDAADATLPSRLLMDSIADGVFTVDKKLRISGFNKAAEDITGWKRTEVIGLPHDKILKCIIPEKCLLDKCLKTGKPVSKSSIYIYGKDGTAIPISISAAPLVDPNGEVLGGVETFRNLTSSIQKVLILDSIADGVFSVDRNMCITAFNAAAEKITGWSAKDVLGVPCHEVFHSSICGDACILAQSVEKEESITSAQTVFLKRKDGQTLPVSISAAPLVDPTGEVIGGVETFRDVTQIIQHEMILDSITDGVFAVDREMCITAFNKAAESITGWSSDEVKGTPCSEVFHSSICGDACILGQSVDSGLPMASNHTVFVKAKDGQTIPININAAPLIDPDGKIIGGVETFRDVTSTIQNDLILDSIADGVFTVDRNWKITSFNRAAEIVTGWSREDAIGKSCSTVFQSSICGNECAIARSMYSGKPVANRSIFIKNSDGDQIPISISASPLADHEGNVIGGVETFRDLSVVTELRKQLNRQYTFGEIVSKSASMQRIFSILPEIAHSESNVLILGESGTGKEIMARAIYDASGRNNKPFIAVNCGALPETLLESELFGYKAGAFTDAKKDKEGRFAAAENGTLFLDEIGDIPASLQVKLLRVLQEKVYEPLGSNKPVHADVRIIAATNRDLQALVKEGLFREDLFYRLNVVKILLPPLRERMEDIPMLVEHFVKKFSAQQGKDIIGVSDAALNILMHYDYPGNIRELENIMEYAFILCQGGFIQPEHLPEPFSPSEKIEETGAFIPGKAQSLEDIEKAAIYQALERNKWKKLATCRELGISKDTLRRKIHRYKLKSPIEKLTEN